MTDQGGARFSLPAGEGAGTMLGMAAGDAAGGASDGAYSSPTQQAVVMAYHLFRHDRVDRDLLAGELMELGGDDVDPSVLRAPSPELQAWLEAVRSGEPGHRSEVSLDPALRAVPFGVWFRRRPEELVDAVLDSVRLTHLDAASAVLATAVAGAVAGGCFAQNGRDLLMAVLEVAERARGRIEEDDLRYAHPEGAEDVIGRLRGTLELVGESDDRLSEAVGDPIGSVSVALALVAPVTREPHRPVAQAAALGGSRLGGLVGAALGARVGVRSWPWDFPNDTWFVAMGERLVEGRSDLVDLPVPYAVEQRVSYSPSHPAL